MADNKFSVFLSKTKYLEGLKCPKLLWYEYHRKDLIPPVDKATQAVFDEGRRVEGFARKLFPGGIRIEREYIPEKQSIKSLEALKSRRPLFEAGFVFGQAYALADILAPVENDEWDLIEIKSSTQIKREHYHDAAFQKYTYEGAGIKIRNCFIMHLNNEYERMGEVEPEKLFIKQDITAEADNLKIGMAAEIEKMLEVIAQKNEPEVKVGPQCSEIRDCMFEDVCWDFLPDEGHVFILRKGGKLRFDLLERGIMRLTDIPKEELDENQLIQVQSHQTGEAHVDKAAIREFLGKLEYPMYFLDFETIAPAVPVYDHSRPYQEIPFQYSLFVVEKEGAEPLHFSYLAPGDVDPRPEILKQLKERLGNKGSIVAYNAAFEKRCIKKASDAFPEYLPWCEEIQERFFDLLEPFKNFSYYHPDQEGSASLKRVMPVLAGKSYESLEIGEGQTAAAEYFRVTFHKDVDEKDRERVRSALLKYCDLDTKGMIGVLAGLKEAGDY